MTPKKRRKLPVILLAVVLLAASLGGGYAAGNLIQQETGHNYINEALGIKIPGRGGNATNPDVDISEMVTINPMP